MYENDVYVRYDPLSASADVRVSTSGEGNFDTVFNGVNDWVYMEEIFNRNDNAIYASPMGSKMAYIEYNDNQVGGNFKIFGANVC